VKNSLLNGAMGHGIVVVGIEAEEEEEEEEEKEKDDETTNSDTNDNSDIQEVINFYYKMKEFLLNQTNKRQAINYGSFGYFTDETNANANENKTKPIPIPISKSN
jgi:hypothetical protein